MVGPQINIAVAMFIFQPHWGGSVTGLADEAGNITWVKSCKAAIPCPHHPAVLTSHPAIQQLHLHLPEEEAGSENLDTQKPFPPYVSGLRCLLPAVGVIRGRLLFTLTWTPRGT
jgi:hypothetical protein